MKEHRSALQSWLASSQAACQDSMLLQETIEDTQSALGLELAGWRELMDSLDDVERRVQEHARVVYDTGNDGRPSTPEGPGSRPTFLWYRGFDYWGHMFAPTALG